MHRKFESHPEQKTTYLNELVGLKIEVKQLLGKLFCQYIILEAKVPHCINLIFSKNIHGGIITVRYDVGIIRWFAVGSVLTK